MPPTASQPQKHAMSSATIHRHTVLHGCWKHYEGNLFYAVFKYTIQFKQGDEELQNNS